jgi:two-component system, LuxR family, sensor kinase FixL
MNWIEIAWIMMTAASLTLGVIHLFIWLKQRSQYANLLFFALAISAAVFSAFELEMLRAQSPAGYVAAFRWAHVPLATGLVSIVWFVYLYFDAEGSGSPMRPPASGSSRSD